MLPGLLNPSQGRSAQIPEIFAVRAGTFVVKHDTQTRPKSLNEKSMDCLSLFFISTNKKPAEPQYNSWHRNCNALLR